jgi:RNA polymerase-binding transcription factor DksA
LSDDVDLANQNTDEAIARTLANRVQKVVTVRPIDCTECGDPIQEKRRELIAGTEHCAECAAYFEERDRLFNGGR